jgi:hypothetical protein
LPSDGIAPFEEDIMTDYSNYSSSQLHEQKQILRDIIGEQRQNRQEMIRLGATDDKRSIEAHLMALYHDIDEINEELTRRREAKEARLARQQMRDAKRKDNPR